VNRALSAAARCPDKEKLPTRNPGGEYEYRWWRSALDGIAALPSSPLADVTARPIFLPTVEPVT
jgi:hypothetical protein